MKFAYGYACADPDIRRALDDKGCRVDIRRRCFDLKVPIVIADFVIARTRFQRIPNHKLHLGRPAHRYQRAISYHNDT